MPRPWIVEPHEPIQKLEPNLWDVAGSLPGGLPLGRRMTIARRRDGRLVFLNAVPLNEAAMRELESFGEPAFLLAPNGYHRIDLHPFQARYPNLRVLAPAAAQTRIREKVDRVEPLSATPPDDDVSLHEVKGTAGREGMMTVRSGERVTLVFADVFFNLPHQKGLPGLALRISGSTGGIRVSRLFRRLAVKGPKAFREGLVQLSNTPGLVRLIASHGARVERAPAEVLRQLAARGIAAASF